MSDDTRHFLQGAGFGCAFLLAGATAVAAGYAIGHEGILGLLICLWVGAVISFFIGVITT